MTTVLRLVKGILRAGAGILHWMLADWRNGPLVIASAFALAHMFLIDPRLRSERDGAIDRFHAEKVAHAGTVENYRLATRQAERNAADNVSRVKARQDAATKEIVDEFQGRLFDARARAARLGGLHAHAWTPAHPGSAASADLPGTGTATPGVASAPGQDRLPPTGELSAGDALIATEQALQLDALIDWALAQSAIDTNPREPQ